MNMEKTADSEEMEKSEKEPDTKPAFKKPVLIGKIGRLPKKMDNKPVDPAPQQNQTEPTQIKTSPVQPETNTDAEEQKLGTKLTYDEPVWGGLPHTSGTPYSLDVLKSGSILENINLMQKSYITFGRLEGCDVVMQHPTISR